ncbi:3-oxoadipate enol-lactonase [Acidovorax sp. 69]|uniref:alpha/beta fold hydrolase n=1 Tax=Acidovorax sp. 69 TaxID=2035202 RepID=UPI000C246B48|nr:alpha/beta fold hydrolase [Acidovorax sp. 69]PJI98198.1 3-oxoadipate enol-lactonase [Acidovorax sp. 69]
MSPLHFVQQGQGPVVVLSHALGCDLQMWDDVASALQDRYTVLRYDHRGHGRSPATEGPYSMQDLADDAAAFIRAHAGGEPVHFVGLSMGGMTAQALAARHPALVRSITIANSACHYDEAAQVGWQTRVTTVLAQGIEPIADGAMQRWFTPEICTDNLHGGSARVAAMRAILVDTAPVPYAAACTAVAAIDLAAGNRSIACPTLVLAGTRDEATPPALSQTIAETIPGAQLSFIDAAHLSAVEKPAEFARVVSAFIAAH